MTTITLERTRIEVPTAGPRRRARPGYRWTTGYWVIDQHGVYEYPPMRRADAYRRARQLGATKIVVKDRA